MIEIIERVRNGLSSKQRKTLIKKLEFSGFTLSPWILGFLYPGWHVYVIDVKKEHPKFWGNYLPVGFIGKDYVEIVNLDGGVFDEYHSKLKKIYFSV